MIEGTSTARNEWRRNWGVVLAGLFGVGLTSTHVYSIGPFIAPLEAEFGWARAQISAGVGVSTFIAAVLSPFLGMAIDKWGPRRIALPGVFIFCSATALLSLATKNVWIWWSLWILVAMGGLLIKPPVWTAAVTSLFERGRGLALAVTLCGTGLASTIMPNVATWLIDSHGWRTAYMLMALMLLVVTFPIFYIFLNSAADQKRRGSAESAHQFVAVGATVREALLSMRFVKLTVAGFVFTTGAIGITSNMVPILTSMHLNRAEAAAVAGLAGLTSVIGRLSTGFIIDRYNGNIVGGVVVLFPMITCALLLLADGGSTEFVIPAAVVLGLALGAELDVIAYLTARHFGTARYGTIFGTVSSVWALAVTVGPTLANYMYDRTGSYSPALWTFLPLFAIASICLLTLGAFPDYESDRGKLEPATT